LEQAIAFNEQYEKGRCDSVGVANLGPEMLQDWIAVAEEKGYVKPIVYQGEIAHFTHPFVPV
jgi:aflatoxin B1 aldehyde reductase